MYRLLLVVSVTIACQSERTEIDGAVTPEQMRVIYVATDGSDAATGAEPDRPVASVGAAMASAIGCRPSPCAVWIAEGVYRDPVVLVAGVELRGGYRRDFAKRDSTQFPVVITSDAPITMTADGVDEPTPVSGLTIRGADLSADDDGSSSYALVVTESDGLRLSGVVIEGGSGASGAAGTDGEAVSCTTGGGGGGQANDCGSSDGGAGDAGGDPIGGGAGGAGGDNNCPGVCPLPGSGGVSDGAPGQPGADGDPGAPGVPASSSDGSFTGAEWQGASGSDGERGKHGTGGGGGGSGGSKSFDLCVCDTLIGGHGGDGAPGGCGGGGGTAGEPGGGAFGLVVVDARVELTGVAIIGGSGGTGGAGGAGRSGEPGGTAVASGLTGAESQRCGVIDYSSGGGGLGGVGGAGGRGGGGAGGAGGASVALARIGTVELIGADGLQIELGTGGAGGAGGDDDNAGPRGTAAGQLQY